jgi:hypothetical protein
MLWVKGANRTQRGGSSTGQDELRGLLESVSVAQRRFQRSRDIGELEAVVPIWRQLLDHPALDSVPAEVRRYVLREGGWFFLGRFSARGEDDDLRRAVTVMERVLAEAPARRGERHQHLSDLGIALRACFERWGDEADIDRAVSCHEQAMRSVRSADRSWPMHAENLANAQWSRYLRFGSLADLEGAAKLHKQAAARFSERSAERPSCLSNLRLVLHAMYEHTGDLGYLEEAVTAARDSVAAGSGQADQYPTCLNTLMIVLQTHYEHTANPDDLDLVIEIGHELVAMTQLGAARAMYLHNLGNALVDRYHLSDDPADLDEAITSHETALAATSDDSPQFAPYLDDWATAVLYRYRLAHHPDDLATVVGAREALTRLLPARSPDVVKYLNNLGLSLLANPDLASEPDGSARATETFRRACSIGLETNPAEVLKAAATWGDWAAERAGWADSATAYEFGLAAIETLFRTQPLRRHKEAWLGTTGDMSVNASYALVRANTAVVCHEHGTTC